MTKKVELNKSIQNEYFEEAILYSVTGTTYVMIGCISEMYTMQIQGCQSELHVMRCPLK